MQAVLDRVGELGRQSQEPAAECEMTGIVNDVLALGDGAQPDYVALRAALPGKLSPGVQRSVVRLIAKRKETRGLAELIAATAQGNEEALTALLMLGSEENWKAAATQLDQVASSTAGKPEHLASLRGRLDAALADPARFAAERRDAERKQVFIEAQRRLSMELRARLPCQNGFPLTRVPDARNSSDSRIASASI